jgi:hypothetical protein
MTRLPASSAHAIRSQAKPSRIPCAAFAAVFCESVGKTTASNPSTPHASAGFAVPSIHSSAAAASRSFPNIRIADADAAPVIRKLSRSPASSFKAASAPFIPP